MSPGGPLCRVSGRAGGSLRRRRSILRATRPGSPYGCPRADQATHPRWGDQAGLHNGRCLRGAEPSAPWCAGEHRLAVEPITAGAAEGARAAHRPGARRDSRAKPPLWPAPWRIMSTRPYPSASATSSRCLASFRMPSRMIGSRPCSRIGRAAELLAARRDSEATDGAALLTGHRRRSGPRLGVRREGALLARYR